MYDILALYKLIIKRIVTDDGVMYIGGSDTLPPPLDAEEELRCIGGLEGGDKDSKAMLIEHNLRLVVYIAKRFENTGVGIEDLVSI